METIVQRLARLHGPSAVKTRHGWVSYEVYRSRNWGSGSHAPASNHEIERVVPLSELEHIRTTFHEAHDHPYMLAMRDAMHRQRSGEGPALPPIRLMRVEDKARLRDSFVYQLVDGHHRLFTARRLGLERIIALVG